MIDINSVREKNIDSFIKLIVQKGAHIDSKIFLREVSQNNIGFVSSNEIAPTKKIISIPKKLLISKDNFQNFLLNKKLNFYDEKLITLYFSILPNFTFFKEKNFYFLSKENIKKCLSFFRNNSPIKKNIINAFEKFNNLEDDFEKYIFLLFRTRSFRVNNQSYLAPLLDSMNFNFSNRGYFYDDNDVYYNSEKKLNKNEEIYQSYNREMDPINFFVNYSFYPGIYSNFSFSENQFILNVPKSAISKIDIKYWNINDDKTISNKNVISFYNFELPLIIDLMFESLTNDKKFISKVIINFLLLAKNQFNIEELNLFLKNVKHKKETVLTEFVKSIKLYCFNLDKIIEKLQL